MVKPRGFLLLLIRLERVVRKTGCQERVSGHSGVEEGGVGSAGGSKADGFYRSRMFGLVNSIPSASILSVGNSTGFVMKTNPSL